MSIHWHVIINWISVGKSCKPCYEKQIEFIISRQNIIFNEGHFLLPACLKGSTAGCCRFILKWRSASFWELYHTVGPILKTGVLRLCQSLVRLCCYCLQLYVCLSVSLMCDCLPYGVWSRSSSSLSVDDEPMHLLFRCRPVNGVSLRLLTYRS